MKMKAIARFGKEFGSYRMVEVPYPTCGPEDIILEIKAAAICGADMKHWRVDNGSDEFNSIRGHEFAGEIVQVGEKVTDWKVGQRVVSDNSAHVCGVCPACEQGDFLCCEEKVNLGMRITHGVSENLYGRASIIWANRLLIILIGPAILLCSVSSTWPDCPKTVTICTAVIGTKMKKRCISFLIGHGRDVKEK